MEKYLWHFAVYMDNVYVNKEVWVLFLFVDFRRGQSHLQHVLWQLNKDI